MFGKKHNEVAKAIMSDKKNKYPFPPLAWRAGLLRKGVGIYDLDDNLLYKFKNNVELAKHLDISKVTVGKYLNSGLGFAASSRRRPEVVYNKTYRFKPIQD